MKLQLSKLELGYHQKAFIRGDLELNLPNKIGIFGLNGSGKTTLLKTILGLIHPLKGEVIYSEKLALSYVPQEDSLNDIFPFKVKEILDIGKTNSLDELIDYFEIKNLQDKLFRELSGGQRQRILLVRAFISSPELIFLDEPWKALDQQSSEKLAQFIEKNHHQSFMMIDHDYQRLFKLCDYCLLLKNQEMIGYQKSEIQYRDLGL